MSVFWVVAGGGPAFADNYFNLLRGRVEADIHHYGLSAKQGGVVRKRCCVVEQPQYHLE